MPYRNPSARRLHRAALAKERRSRRLCARCGRHAGRFWACIKCRVTEAVRHRKARARACLGRILDNPLGPKDWSMGPP